MCQGGKQGQALVFTLMARPLCPHSFPAAAWVLGNELPPESGESVWSSHSLIVLWVKTVNQENINHKHTICEVTHPSHSHLTKVTEVCSKQKVPGFRKKTDGEGVFLHFQLLTLAGITVILEMGASNSQNSIISFSEVTHLIPFALISGPQNRLLIMIWCPCRHSCREEHHSEQA